MQKRKRRHVYGDVSEKNFLASGGAKCAFRLPSVSLRRSEEVGLGRPGL
jgi:hypothetical protein